MVSCLSEHSGWKWNQIFKNSSYSGTRESFSRLWRVEETLMFLRGSLCTPTKRLKKASIVDLKAEQDLRNQPGKWSGECHPGQRKWTGGVPPMAQQFCPPVRPRAAQLGELSTTAGYPWKLSMSAYLQNFATKNAVFTNLRICSIDRPDFLSLDQIFYR